AMSLLDECLFRIQNNADTIYQITTHIITDYTQEPEFGSHLTPTCNSSSRGSGTCFWSLRLILGLCLCTINSATKMRLRHCGAKKSPHCCVLSECLLYRR
ncbi:hypothetical protein STEG23_011323, partial [Scotinomys teguina]